MSLVEKDAAVMIADKEIDEKLFQETFELVKNKELLYSKERSKVLWKRNCK